MGCLRGHRGHSLGRASFCPGVISEGAFRRSLANWNLQWTNGHKLAGRPLPQGTGSMAAPSHPRLSLGTQLGCSTGVFNSGIDPFNSTSGWKHSSVLISSGYLLWEWRAPKAGGEPRDSLKVSSESALDSALHPGGDFTISQIVWDTSGTNTVPHFPGTFSSS